MSGTYLYCQNPECREYLGSLGGDSCPHCGWSSGQQEREIPEDEDGVNPSDDGEAWERAARFVVANPRPIEEIRRDIAKLRDDLADGVGGTDG